jgi:hypothetical protein
MDVHDDPHEPEPIVLHQALVAPFPGAVACRFWGCPIHLRSDT